jgi:hypothetical protein
MDAKIFIEDINVIAITGNAKQAEFHVKSGECFVIGKETLEKGLAIIKAETKLVKLFTTY